MLACIVWVLHLSMHLRLHRCIGFCVRVHGRWRRRRHVHFGPPMRSAACLGRYSSRRSCSLACPSAHEEFAHAAHAHTSRTVTITGMATTEAFSTPAIDFIFFYAK